MTCDDFQLRLTAFSLGELEAEELEAAREHVAGCDDCASRALLDRQLTALARGSAVRLVPLPRTTAAWSPRRVSSPSTSGSPRNCSIRRAASSASGPASRRVNTFDCAPGASRS